VYICICHAVTEPEIRREVVGGAYTQEEVGSRCGAGTGCGSCLDRIAALIAQHTEVPVTLAG
jgi:bacterioferritin-associated ferredoxin